MLPGNIAVVKEGLQLNGYIDLFLISCRYATAPEIVRFYEENPYNYSPEKAESVTQAARRQCGKGIREAIFTHMMATFANLLQSN